MKKKIQLALICAKLQPKVYHCKRNLIFGRFLMNAFAEYKIQL